MPDVEQANSQIVHDFISGWTEPGFDVAQSYGRYLASDCVHRMSEEHAPLTSAGAAIEAMQAFLAAGGAVIRADIVEIIARGPVVLNVRDDVVRIPGQGDIPFHIAAVFVIRDGRIAEWNEYFI